MVVVVLLEHEHKVRWEHEDAENKKNKKKKKDKAPKRFIVARR